MEEGEEEGGEETEESEEGGFSEPWCGADEEEGELVGW